MKNFGPVEDLDIEIKDFQVFIGPQTSGKSTVGKAVYFFKSLRDELIRYVYESVENNEINKPLGEYGKVIRSKFLGIWGSTFHMKNILLRYYYTKEVYISISLENNNKFVNPDFSKLFQDHFFTIIREAERYRDSIRSIEATYVPSRDIVNREIQKRAFFSIIERLANELFNDDQEIVYIPAGRSLLSVLSGQLQNISDRNIDLLMRDFLYRISDSKSIFNKSLQDIVIEKQLTTNEPVDMPTVETAQRVIHDILQGEYVNDKDGEKIKITRNGFVKLNYASSGQQEALWILHLIFQFILDHKKCFFLIEEPEAHLYPEAQKKIVELIALLFNSASNRILITTHSPYILGAINNLLLAGQIGTHNEAVRSVVNPKIWMDVNRIGAYFISNGVLENIIDPELLLIQNEAIDSASTIINREFDALYEMQ